MKREILISVYIHIGMIFICLLPSLFKLDKGYPRGEVYSVQIVSSRPSPHIVEEPEKQIEKKEEKREERREEKREERREEKREEKREERRERNGNLIEGTVGRLRTDADFKYSFYLSIIISRIGENWKNPYRGEGISAVVHFIITRDGSIEGIRLHKSSRNYLFDQSVIRAVKRTKRLPPLPSEYKEDRLGVFFEFVYTP